ncbi:MAG: hypothetical protein WEE66_11925 [Actinomycetota bacterium]
MRLASDRDVRVYRQRERGLFWLIAAASVVGLVWLASSAYVTIRFALEGDVELDGPLFRSTRWLQVVAASSRPGYMVLLAATVMALLLRPSRRA